MSNIIKHVYIPAIKAHYPSGLEEMQGIADGAEVSLESVILLNARYDLARLGDNSASQAPLVETNGTKTTQDDSANECTSAVFLKGSTESGDVINAQNWDMSARLWLTDAVIYLEVHPDPSEHKPSMFFVTEAGQLGRSGMNSNGLGVTANSLMSTDDYTPNPRDAQFKPVLPISLLRRMILECDHFAEALTAAQNFPRHVSNNLTIATTDGFGMCLEITPDRVYKVYGNIDDNYLIHTNHFTHNGFESRKDVLDRYPGGSSWFRRRRFEQGIRSFKDGSLSNEKIINAFSDHLSHPESLCCHPDDNPVDAIIGNLPGYPFRSSSATVACVLYNLTQKTVTVCKGPPCQGTFQKFELKGQKASREMKETTNGVKKSRPEIP